MFIVTDIYQFHISPRKPSRMAYFFQNMIKCNMQLFAHYICALNLQGRIPVKWMAIESLFDHIYTTQSDV